MGGAVVALILIVVGIVVFSGGDDENAAKKITVSHHEESGSSDQPNKPNKPDKPDRSNDSKSGSSSRQVNKGLEKGLIAALNFDSSLKAKNDSGIVVEKLKSSASYQAGLNGKGLLLDRNHYYRLPLKGRLPSGASANFSISLWVKNMGQQVPALIRDKPWKKGENRKLSGKDDSEFWQWTPENAFKRDGKASSRKGWSMVTLVFSRGNDQVRVYNNGEMIGESSSATIESLASEKYLYIGCDSRQKFNFSSPSIIDQLYIWDRKLSSKEIRILFEEAITL